MSKYKGNRPPPKQQHQRPRPIVGEKAKEAIENMDEDNPVFVMFRQYASELDDKHDRYERIVKLGRDVTIEAKRIIFLLHSTNTDIDSKKKSIIEEADNRLKVLVDTNFTAIAKELQNQDPYQYQKAYTGAMQEFIEALTFSQFLKSGSIDKWSNTLKLFTYKNDAGVEYNLLFPQYDFILGIMDFTGELMRRCINTLGGGNVDECFKLCDFVKYINEGVLGLVSAGNKELSRKAYVLRQSLAKMELVCYNIRIRGSEVPKHMLISVIESSDTLTTDDDEGFY